MSHQIYIRNIVLLWCFVVLGFVIVFGVWANLNFIQQRTVPKEETFRREDAVELMEALCLMNKDLRCPDPYQLPGYFALTNGDR